MSIFNYAFMQRAFIVAFFISLAIPMIGNIIVLKRLSNMGDALSHSGLAGVAIGLFIGINPVLGALIACICSAFLIECIRKSFSRYSEISTSIVMSVGICLAAIFSGFIKSSTDFNSFLFGSIVAISHQELFAVIVLSLFVVTAMWFLYKALFYISFDEESALISGLPVQFINFVFVLLTSIVVSISSRSVGAFIISSLLVLPVACAMQISWSFKSNLFISIIFGMIFMFTGLFLSFYFDLKPGGAIILVGLVFFLSIIFTKKLLGKK